MSSESKEKDDKRKQATRILADLRKQNSSKVKKAQELLKEQQTIRKALRRFLLNAPHSVPQLSSATKIPADIVLWHIAAMKKYGIVEEAGMDEASEYYLYSLTDEAEL